MKHVPIVCYFDMCLGAFWSASTAILIQNNVDTPNAFNRPWVDFQNGFSDSNGNYWLGNDALHSYLTPGPCQLYVYVFPVTGGVYLAIYQWYFVVGDSSTNYQLSASKSGGNTTIDGIGNISGAFSTYDRDNDHDPTNNCASKYGCGGWFGSDTMAGSLSCGTTMLNGYGNNLVWGNPSSSIVLQRSQMWMICWQ